MSEVLTGMKVLLMLTLATCSRRGQREIWASPCLLDIGDFPWIFIVVGHECNHLAEVLQIRQGVAMLEISATF